MTRRFALLFASLFSGLAGTAELGTNSFHQCSSQLCSGAITKQSSLLQRGTRVHTGVVKSGLVKLPMETDSLDKVSIETTEPTLTPLSDQNTSQQSRLTPVTLPNRISLNATEQFVIRNDNMEYFALGTRAVRTMEDIRDGLDAATEWHGDVFGEVKAAGKRGEFSATTKEWLVFVGAIIVLMIVDFVFIQPLTVNWSRDSSYVDEGLIVGEDKFRYVFDYCDVNKCGQISRRELIVACETNAEVAEVFAFANGQEQPTIGVLDGLGATIESQFSWEEFKAYCATLQSTVPASPPTVPQKRAVGRHLMVLAFWVLVGLAFNGWIFWARGPGAAFEWFSGYFLEWILSVDNLLVFHLIFRVYRTPRQLMHKAVFMGFIGAVLFRMCFFWGLNWCLHMVHSLRFVFGMLLVYSAIQAASDADDEVDLQDTIGVKGLKWCLGDRLLSTYDTKTNRLCVWKDGRCYATLLVLVVGCVEITDVLFAVDSVTAKVAMIPDHYIAYSSSVIATFGLRATFFIIQDLVECFETLKYGLCFILVFIGIELMVSDFVMLPAQVVCVVILSVFAVCVAASTATAIARKFQHRGTHENGRQSATSSVPELPQAVRSESDGHVSRVHAPDAAGG